jgi:hypothetical protein
VGFLGTEHENNVINYVVAQKRMGKPEGLPAP